MYPREAIPEPWGSFLNELDRIATSTVRLDCIGGFVVTMLYGLSRPTADADVLEIAPRSRCRCFLAGCHAQRAGLPSRYYPAQKEPCLRLW